MSALRAFCAECSHVWECGALIENCPSCSSRQVRGMHAPESTARLAVGLSPAEVLIRAELANWSKEFF